MCIELEYADHEQSHSSSGVTPQETEESDYRA